MKKKHTAAKRIASTEAEGIFQTDASRPRDERLRETEEGRHELMQVEEARRASEQDLAGELQAAQRLQEISAQLIEQDDIKALYEKILDAAVAIMRSDFASMQMLVPERCDGQGELLLLGHRGFTPESAEAWKWVRTDGNCICGEAMRTNQRVIVPDFEDCRFMAGTPGLEIYRQNGIRSAQSTLLRSRGGNVLGMISTHWRQLHQPSEHTLRLFDVLARQTADLIERKRAEDSLREREARLAEELAATQQLQQISTQLIHQDNIQELYEKILDAAVTIMHSDYASIQMLYADRGENGELRLLGFRGFNPEAAKFWEWVRPASESTCGMTLRTGHRCIVADVEQCDFMAGSEDLAIYLQTGIHAVQTTPLISRTGKLVGTISTHWREPRQPAGAAGG
jgi:GAF domain-containing protein